MNHTSNNKESKWLANIDPNLLDELNKEKQLNDQEISLFVTLHRTLKLKVTARSQHADTTRLVCPTTRIMHRFKITKKSTLVLLRKT